MMRDLYFQQKGHLSYHMFHTGDSITISWNNVTYRYIIRELVNDLVYISPISDMDIRNIIVYIDGRWRVKGREEVDYKIEFPPTNISIGSVSPSQVSPNQISPNPETQIKVDYGEFSDKIPETNAMYDNIADRFQTFANEAGMGGAPQRHFDGGSFIQYAIDNGIWEQSVDDIYEHMVRKKLEGDLVLQQELQQQQQEIYPLSKNGRQCISQCKRYTNGNCYCDVEKYTGWTGTFDWDYCDDQYCNPLVPQ
jgi:hypothetical protein